MKRVLFVVAAGLMALTACDKKVDTAQVEKTIRERLDQLASVEKVSCPKGVKVKKDETFECKVKFKGSDELAIVATITEVSGSTFKYNYKPTEPWFGGKLLTDQAQAEVRRQTGTEATVDCGPFRKLSGTGTETCDGKTTTGEAFKIEISVDKEGTPTDLKIPGMGGGDQGGGTDDGADDEAGGGDDDPDDTDPPEDGE